MKKNHYKIHYLLFITLSIILLSNYNYAEGSRKTVASLSTDLYEVHLHKNGTVRILFANGTEILKLDYPAVTYANKEEKELLRVSGLNWYKEPIKNPLGEGMGLFLEGKNVSWVIEAYPGKPFLTARLRFTNNTKKEVKIQSLIPIQGLLSQFEDYKDATKESIVCLGNGNIFESMTDYPQWINNSFDIKTQWNLTLFDKSMHQTILTGFLTFKKAYSRIILSEDPKKKKVFMSSECIFDPVINLAPGQFIDAELLYLSIVQESPHICMERYGRAISVFNKLQKNSSFLPHGWDSWSTARNRDINEDIILRNIYFVDENLKRYGWNTISIDAGWERGPADWEPHPDRFPNGLKPTVEEIHRRDMKAGLWVDLFTIPEDSNLAKEHPDWLVLPDSRGKLLLGKDKKVLDVTIPEAYAYVRDICKKISDDWGFDGLVEADFVYHLLLAEGYRDKNLTKLEVFCHGLESIREGIGSDKFLMTMVPIPISGMFADGIRIGFDNKPLWSSNALTGNWGCVESLNNFARRYYLFPHLGVPDQDCVFLGHTETNQRWRVPEDKKLTTSQFVAWATGTSLTGGVFKIGEEFTTLNTNELNILRKIIPKTTQPARPIDLFENPYPRIWALPISGHALNGMIVAVFNWDVGKYEKVPVYLNQLGLTEGKLYTLYDFWNESFLGIIQNAFVVDAPPSSVSLFGIRLLEDKPMFVASNHHITQGMLDVVENTYVPTENKLSGKMKVIEDTDYSITFFVPKKKTIKMYEFSVPNVSFREKEGVITFQFNVPKNVNTLEWNIFFD